MIIRAMGLEPEGLAVDTPLEIEPLTSDADEPILAEAVVLRGLVTPKRQGLAFRGRITGRIVIPCARCLTSFRMAVDRAFDLFFVFTWMGEKEVQIPDDALDYAFIGAEGGIDLKQVATEQIYLELPMKPLCQPACRGLCPRCGGNLNAGECACEGLSPLS